MPHTVSSEDYYLFSSALPEDKTLRQYLHRKKLVKHSLLFSELTLIVHNLCWESPISKLKDAFSSCLIVLQYGYCIWACIHNATHTLGRRQSWRCSRGKERIPHSPDDACSVARLSEETERASFSTCWTVMASMWGNQTTWVRARVYI